MASVGTARAASISPSRKRSKGQAAGRQRGSATDPTAGVVTPVLKGTASMSRRPTFDALALSPLALVAILLMVVALVTHDAAASTPPLFLPAVNNSTGGLDTIFPNSGGPVWMAAADVNGDGALDILVANWCVTPQECTRSNVGVLMNAGHGTFRPAVTYDTGGYHAFSVSVADVNDDGKADLVVANGCGDALNQPSPGCPDGSIGVLLGNGDGTFLTVRTSPSGGSLTGMVMADLNGDARLDVVVSNCASNGQLCPSGRGNVGVLLSNGDGSFQPVQSYDSGGFAATDVTVADVNGDHEPDVLVTNQRICDNCVGNVGLLLAHGDGTFATAQTYDAGIFAPAFIIATDLDGDMKTDLVLTENIGGGGQLAVLLNRGDGTFNSPVAYATGGLYATPLVVSDMNGDRKPDLVVSNAGFCTGHPPSAGCVGILLGNGDGTFQPAVTSESGGIGAWSLTVADFDGDGKLDVAVANQCNASGCAGAAATVGVLIGNGDGTVRPVVRHSTDVNSVLVLAADLNGDGKPDLAVGNAPPSPSGSVSVLLNNAARDDATPPVITLSTTPTLLWPPNGRLVPVTMSGTITDTGSGIKARSAVYSVSDEYGEVRPTGVISVGPSGHYSFTVLLQASRRGSDRDGRRYRLTVRAEDNAGNAASTTAAVTVPHDRRD